MARQKTQRRWLQYGFKTMLLVVLGAAVGAAWWRYASRQVARDQAIESIRKLGGTVTARARERTWTGRLMGEHALEVSQVSFEGMATLRNEDLQILQLLPEAAEVSLEGCSSIDSGGLRRLAHLSLLKRVSLTGTSVDASGLQILADLPELESLSLEGSKVNLAAVQQLSGLRHLRELDLRNLKGERVEIRGFSGLVKLDLDGSLSGGLRQLTLANLPALAELSLGRITVDGDVCFQQLPSLQTCWFEGRVAGRVSLEGIGPRASCLRARSVEVAPLTPYRSNGSFRVRQGELQYVQLCGFTLDAVDVAGLTGLWSLSLQGVELDDAHISAIASVKTIESLVLSDVPGFSARQLTPLQDLSNLKLLDLSGNSAIGDDLFDYIGRFPALETLHIARTSVTAQALDSYCPIRFTGSAIVHARATNLGNAGERQEQALNGRRYLKEVLVVGD